jgi:hypothetical protein
MVDKVPALMPDIWTAKMPSRQITQSNFKKSRKVGVFVSKFEAKPKVRSNDGNGG